MATHVATTLVSDLSGSTDSVETVSFTFDKQQFDIELDAAERAEFRSLMERYVKAGRRRRGNPASRPGTGSGKMASSYGRAIREWAYANGKMDPEKGKTGRIPDSVIQGYLEEHQGARTAR
jgi:hypothetical protein